MGTRLLLQTSAWSDKLITNTLLLHHGIPLVLDIVVGTILKSLPWHTT
jgi:hypothetical protein